MVQEGKINKILPIVEDVLGSSLDGDILMCFEDVEEHFDGED